MTISHLAIIYKPTVAITLLSFLGCLSSDSVLNLKSQIKKKTHISETKQHTTAPLKINPTILRNRTFKEAPMLVNNVGKSALPSVSERPIANSIQLNLAKDYQFQDEGRIAIFKIRRGEQRQFQAAYLRTHQRPGLLP